MGIIDLVQYEKDQDAERKDAQDALDKELGEVKDTSGAIPEKFRGKSLEEVISIAETLERKASRLGNEVGQLRQLRAQVELEPQKRPEKKEVNVDALLENPSEAVETIVNQSAEVTKLRQTVDQLSSDTAKREFETQYPDYAKDLIDEEFMDWATKNPVRRALASAADQYDYRAARELWNMWGERKELVGSAEKQKKEAKEANRERKLRDGTLESGTGNSTETKKVFSRREIRDIRTKALQGDRKSQDIVNDPEWNAAVMSAYIEKRAK